MLCLRLRILGEQAIVRGKVMRINSHLYSIAMTYVFATGKCFDSSRSIDFSSSPSDCTYVETNFPVFSFAFHWSQFRTFLSFPYPPYQKGCSVSFHTHTLIGHCGEPHYWRE